MRLIDADDILTKINKQSCDGCYNHDELMCRSCYVADNKYMIEDAPTIDPIKHGEWLYRKKCIFSRKCSVCGAVVDVVYANKFCCCCGSMNRKGEQPHEVD